MLAYVAGPYRASSEFGLLQNIRKAEALSVKLWQLGIPTICPHKNSAYLGGAAPDQVWLDGYLEIMRRCDVVVCVDDWEKSSGTQAEVKLAKSLGIPVFWGVTADFMAWRGAAVSPNRDQPRIAICGPGRSGKDTCSRWFAEHTTLQYQKSTSEGAAYVVFDRWGYEHYKTVDACWQARHQHRDTWAKIIWDYNQPDGLTLYRDMGERNDILNGIRRAGELEACRQAGLVDMAIYVDRPHCVDSSCEIVPTDCELVLYNCGTVLQLEKKLHGVAKSLRVLRTIGQVPRQLRAVA